MASPVAYPPAPATAAIPVLERRVAWRDTVRALHIREYRWYASSFLVVSIGMWIARIATDWLVLEITGDVAMVGIVIAMQMLPPMMLGAWGGVISDWMPPRTAIIFSQLLFATAFVWLGVLVLAGGITVAWVLALSALVGVVSCVDGPSRAVLTHQAVGTDVLPNAISLNAIVPQIAGVVGAALAGVAIAAVDIGWTLIAAAIAAVLGTAAVLCIHSARLEPRERFKPERGAIRAALKYAGRKPAISLSLIMVGVLAISGLSASVLYAWAAETKFDIGSAGYSMFSTIGAAGALVGGILATRPRRYSVQDNAVMLGISGVIWLISGLSPLLAIFIGGMVATGIARMLFLVANDTVTQLSSNARIRGRIVSLYMMTATGGQVIGSVLIGWIVSTFGGEVAFVVTGVAPMITAAVICLLLAARRRRSRMAETDQRGAR